MAETLSVPVEYKREAAVFDQRAHFEQRSSKVGGAVKSAAGKAADIATGISKVTIWGFGGMWAAGALAPEAVASAGFNPESVEKIGKWGTIFDAATLAFDKVRPKGGQGGGSASEGRMKRVFKTVFSPAIDAANQANPFQKSTKHAFGF